MSNECLKINVGQNLYVTTLTLGSQPMQRGHKGAGQKEAQESHHIVLS